MELDDLAVLGGSGGESEVTELAAAGASSTSCEKWWAGNHRRVVAEALGVSE